MAARCFRPSPTTRLPVSSIITRGSADNTPVEKSSTNVLVASVLCSYLSAHVRRCTVDYYFVPLVSQKFLHVMRLVLVIAFLVSASNIDKCGLGYVFFFVYHSRVFPFVFLCSYTNLHARSPRFIPVDVQLAVRTCRRLIKRTGLVLCDPTALMEGEATARWMVERATEVKGTVEHARVPGAGPGGGLHVFKWKTYSH